MEKKILSVLFMMLMVAGGTHAQQTKYSGTINNLKREWIFYVPQSLPASAPLVFCLQGCCSDYAAWATQSEYNKVADTAKIVVCYPKADSTPGQINWNDWDVTGDKDLKFILALIDTAVLKYQIDRNRIYATGFSYGGCFSNYLGCMYPDKFAAIAPSAGYVMTLKLKERTNCKNTRPVPVLQMHGTKDQVVAYSGGVSSVAIWVKNNECPQTAQVTANYQGSATVKKEYYGPCKDNTEVVFLSAEGMDHSWMTKAKVGVSAAVESWNFMSKYSLPSTAIAGRAAVRTALVSNSAIAVYHDGKLSLRGAIGASDIRLFTTNGRMVGAWRHPGGSCRFLADRLNRGIYLLSVGTSHGSVVMRIPVN